MGRISKMGDRYLRRLLVVGMTSLVRRARTLRPRLIRASLLCLRVNRHVSSRWLPPTARRIAWAIMTRGGTYRDRCLRSDEIQRRRPGQRGCKDDEK